MMRPRPFFPILGVALAGLLLANLLIAPLLERWGNSFQYRKLLDHIQLAQRPDMVFVGNSLLDGRIDSAALNRGAALSGVTFAPLNSALSATDAPDQALLSLYALRQHPELHTLVLGFYDYQLTEQTRLTPNDLTGNHGIALDKRFPLTEVSSVYEFSRAQRAEFFLFRHLPMAADRLSVWKYVELLRRSMGAIGMPPPPPRSGLWSIRPAEYYVAQPRLFLADPTHFNSSYERIFAQAENHRMRVVLVLMPMSPLHRDVFYKRASWNEYLAKLHALAQQRGFDFIDAVPWMPASDDFQDAIHMTPSASEEFSLRLGAELGKLQTQSLRATEP